MSTHKLDEERIFHLSREIPGQSARSEYLDQVCAGDLALRERVEQLMRVHEQEQNFLKSGDAPAPTEAMGELNIAAGQQIGRYKLLQKIGEGGFGVVFMAEQSRPVRRKVALKVIKPGMDSQSVVARFEAERQALAMMDHPHIARVFDGGATDAGRPYFVMELVKGVPITEFCDQNELSTELRLKLFISVCQAVQHAHQKGIIHRDLKPSNVLVTLADGQPVVKVIDFGVAKATHQQLTEKTLFTAFGQMVGTPQYMSPEQAEMSCLDIDTRSDVYSLGVLLYELLTGTTPLAAERLRTAGYAEMQRLIREEEPPKPSTRLSTSGEKLTVLAKHRKVTPEKLKSQVKGDLDWIVMKALEKDRNRRYASPALLGDDVLRVLSDEPVEARAPSRSYRARKFIRRNRLLVSAVSVVTVALVCGLGLALWGMWVAQEERTKVQAVLQQLQEELLNQAFELAFAGDLVGTEDALAKAEQAEAPERTRSTIRGIAHLYAGDADRAVGILDTIVEDRPNDLAAVCAASWANMRASRFDAAGALYSRIGEIAEAEDWDDHAVLLLAQVKVYGTTDLPGLIGDLDGLIERHPRWGIAYVLRAQAKTQLFSTTQSFDEAQSAAEDSVHANRLLYNNPFVLAATLEVHTAAIELARHLGKDTKPYERYADEIAKQIDQWPHDLHARHRRLLYYLVKEHEDFAAEKQKLFDDGWAFTQPQLAGLIQHPDGSKLQRFAEQHSSRRTCQIALALHEVLYGNPEHGLEMHDKLAAEAKAFNTRLLMLDIPALAQRPELAAAAAKRLLADLPKHDPAHYWRFEVTCARYWAQEPAMSDEEFLNCAGPLHIERSTAHYFIGMRAIAEGDIPKAREHLQVAAESGPAGWWYESFSKAYLKLMDEGRIPTSSELSSPMTSEQHEKD
jgi:serine/threonine protein kinase/transcriptional regulator of met regulon